MARVQLTDRFVASAKPLDGKQTDYFDSVTRGLAMRVGTTGARTWTYNYTSPRDGKRARLTIGTYPATSLASARGKAIEAKGLLEDNLDPRDVAAAQAQGRMTVGILAESYLTKHVRANLRSAAAVERRLVKNVLPLIGRLPLAELHRRDVNRVLDPILARGAKTEAGRVFEDMRAMLHWASSRGDIEHSPMAAMQKPHGSPPRERVLNDDELRKLWHELPASLARSKTCQRIIRVCLITGQRVGEVAGMRRDELDLQARQWVIPGARTKNGTTHSVPLSGLAMDVIAGAMAAAGEDAVFVFPCGERAMSPHAVARTIGRAQEVTKERPNGRFGIPHWTAHDLRRTCLSNLAKLGIPPVVAGAVANHLSVTKANVTLSVYTQYSYADEKRKALELWARSLKLITNWPESYEVDASRCA